jgi:hypothetical protein
MAWPRIAKYVFCDQPAFLTTNPNWTTQQVANYGSIFTPDAVISRCAAGFIPQHLGFELFQRIKRVITETFATLTWTGRIGCPVHEDSDTG